jgi:hypothetical protein
MLVPLTIIVWGGTLLYLIWASMTLHQGPAAVKRIIRAYLLLAVGLAVGWLATGR